MNDDETLGKLLDDVLRIIREGFREDSDDERIKEELKKASERLYKRIISRNPSSPFKEKDTFGATYDMAPLPQNFYPSSELNRKATEIEDPLSGFEYLPVYRQENPFPEQNFPEIKKSYKIGKEEPGQKQPDGLEGKL